LTSCSVVTLRANRTLPTPLNSNSRPLTRNNSNTPLRTATSSTQGHISSRGTNSKGINKMFLNNLLREYSIVIFPFSNILEWAREIWGDLEVSYEGNGA